MNYEHIDCLKHTMLDTITNIVMLDTNVKMWPDGDGDNEPDIVWWQKIGAEFLRWGGFVRNSGKYCKNCVCRNCIRRTVGMCCELFFSIFISRWCTICFFGSHTNIEQAVLQPQEACLPRPRLCYRSHFCFSHFLLLFIVFSHFLIRFFFLSASGRWSKIDSRRL